VYSLLLLLHLFWIRSTTAQFPVTWMTASMVSMISRRFVSQPTSLLCPVSMRVFVYVFMLPLYQTYVCVLVDYIQPLGPRDENMEKTS